MKIQVCCKKEPFYRVRKGQGSLPVIAARLPVAAVRQAYCADPKGFSLFYLAEEEQEEWASFRFPQKKFPWLAARVVAKRLYCRYMGRKGKVFHPRDVVIRKNRTGPGRGKPLLRTADPAGPAHFSDLSLSHAGQWALCALASNGRVGIDLEPLDDPAPSFIKLVYTPAEVVALNALFDRMTLPERVKLLWVMKESLLKALGVGFYYGLGSVRLTGANEAGPVFITAPALLELPVGTVNMSYGVFNGCIFCITLVH
ncbi:MAG: 4'-phosphopantetheinyl transferase superfamily protein [Bacillota bacterium]